MTLSLDKAIEFVRARIDELAENESDMLTSDPENLNLNKTVGESVCEAADAIHLAAPFWMVEGLPLTEADAPSWSLSTEGVLDVSFLGTDTDVLRLVSFKASDSGIVITNPVDEDSPRARMQLNSYIMGRPDNPTLVKMSDSLDLKPHYRYYTTGSQSFEMRYIPKAVLSDEGTVWAVRGLELPILNYLTAIVLRAFHETDLAQAFETKAAEYLK